MTSKIIRSKLSDVSIPTDISLSEFILNKIAAYGDDVALVDGDTGRHITYSEIISSVRRVASGLWRSGIRKRDVVLIYAANCIEYPVVFYAVNTLGAILTTCNPVYTVDEVVQQCENSNTSAIFTTKPFLEKIRKAVSRSKVTVRHIFVIDGDQISDERDDTTTYSTLLQDDGSCYHPAVINSRGDLAMVPYSSGTSGLPKGVMLSHYNLISATCQISHPDLDVLTPGRVFVAFLPFFHIYGIDCFLLCALYGRCKVIVMSEFEPIKYLTLVAKYKATSLHIVPPVALFLAKHPIVDKFDLTAAREILVGAAPLAEELSKEVMKRLNLKLVRQGYGLTETTAIGTIALPTHWKHGSSGSILSNTEFKLINTENGKLCGPHVNGEVCIKGPQLMLGYLNNPKATMETIDAEGWLHTGDVGYYDEEQYIYIVDRIKELIKYKGFQVAPAELEGLLMSHPAIADAAVIGIPDDAAGELPRAYVIIKPNAKCNEADIHAFTKDKVAHYKQFRGGISIVQEIPKSPSGKILRRKIKADYLSQRTSKL